MLELQTKDFCQEQTGYCGSLWAYSRGDHPNPKTYLTPHKTLYNNIKY
jgi:hypothetical protein